MFLGLLFWGLGLDWFALCGLCVLRVVWFSGYRFGFGALCFAFDEEVGVI